MQFRTEINPEQSQTLFLTSSKVLTIGSCFSNVLGDYLIENKVDCISNPFGTVFNPFSIIHLLELTLYKSKINDNLFVERDNQWFHYDFHSQFYSDSKSDLEIKLNRRIYEIYQYLKQTDFLIITFGTSHAYLHKENTIVSNCHKINASNFKKISLNIEEIKAKMNEFLKKLKAFNPKINVILTVSPVRHIKETLVFNSLSKASLIVLSHSLTSNYVKYFPSFELMNDDLRDYRFYKNDLIHPSDLAENYIIQKFAATYFDKNLNEMIDEWKKIKLDLNHKILNPGNFKHQLFLENLKIKLINFSKYKDVSKEIEEVETKLQLI